MEQVKGHNGYYFPNYVPRCFGRFYDVVEANSMAEKLLNDPYCCNVSIERVVYPKTTIFFLDYDVRKDMQFHLRMCAAT